MIWPWITVWKTASPTRITLINEAGDPVARWSLQVTDREGREIRYRAEGILSLLGSATAWRRIWKHKGFRMEMGFRWGAGLTSMRETWAAGAWSAAVSQPTATAHAEIMDWAAKVPVWVEPLVGDLAPAFAATASEKGPSLSDTKGIIHPRLELTLVATTLTAALELFSATPTGWGRGPYGALGWGK